jgi:hypothetical protein
MARWNLKGERDRRGSVNPDAVSIPARREWRGKTGAARRAPTRLRRSAGAAACAGVADPRADNFG